MLQEIVRDETIDHGFIEFCEHEDRPIACALVKNPYDQLHVWNIAIRFVCDNEGNVIAQGLKLDRPRRDRVLDREPHPAIGGSGGDDSGLLLEATDF